MLKYSFFFILCSILTFCQKQKILFSVMPQDKIHNQFVKNNGIDSVIIFYQNEFTEIGGLNYDRKLLAENIKKRIPNEKQTGYAALDWEGEAINIIYGYKSVPQSTFTEMRNRFIEAIKIAKSLRPNMKWSYYNVPPINYGKVTAHHSSVVRGNLKPLLKEVDYLAPSLYILNNPSEKNPQFTYDYAASNTIFALQLAQELKKEVFPFIWHRYSDHSVESSGNLVGTVFFDKFISSILTANYNGKSVNGVIWWECEDYIINNTRLYPNLKIGLVRNPSLIQRNTYKVNVYNQYLPIIKKNLKK